jgi:uncharacterized protein (TIRG00374 family)
MRRSIRDEDLNLQSGLVVTRTGGRWRIAIGLIVSAACVGVLVRFVDWRQTIDALGGAEIGWIALAALLLAGCYGFFSLRWWALLGCDPLLPPRRLFAVLMMGFALNVVLPLRPGDALRAYLVGHVYGGGTSRALGSIVLERILDLAAVLFIGGLAGVMAPLPASMRGALIAASLVVAAAVAIVVSLAWFSAPLSSVFERMVMATGRRWPALIASQFAEFSRALTVAGSPVHLLLAAGIGMAGWALYSGAMIACCAAFGISSTVIGGLSMTAATNLGGMIPSSPGSIGVYHGLAVLVLGASGTAQAPALAIALISHALVVATQLLFGLLALTTVDRGARASIKLHSQGAPADRM